MPEVKPILAEKAIVAEDKKVTEPEATATKPIEKPAFKSEENITVKTVEKPAEKSTLFIPNLNGASTSVKIPSLKDLAKTSLQETIEEDPYLKGTDFEDFDYEKFLKKWKEYAAKAKAEDKSMTLLTVFNNQKPVMLKPYVFELLLENKSQENIFRDDKPNLMNFLRSELKNFNIEIQTRIEEQSGSRKPYSPVEKFQYMLAKKPELADLKKRFNLEID